MRVVHYPLQSNIDVNELKKLVSFISEKVQNYEVKDSKLILYVDDDANEESILCNAKLLIREYLSFNGTEEIIYQKEIKKKYISISNVLNSHLIHEFGFGLLGLSEKAVFLFRYFDNRFKRIALSINAVEKLYPVLLPLDGYEKTGYLKTSPQYSMFCCSFYEDVNELLYLSSSDNNYKLKQPREVLSPAACFHTYLELMNSDLQAPSVYTFNQNVFRNEGRFNWGGFGRLKDYHVREIVCIGSDDFVVEMRTKILNETISILEDLELSSSISIASDPFILPKMQKYKKLQHQESSKLELRLNYSKDEQLSCTSFNLHGTSFSHPFNIEVKGCGETVTGCVGYGIERWVLAFMCQYGLEVNNWPQKIRGEFDNEKYS